MIIGLVSLLKWVHIRVLTQDLFWGRYCILGGDGEDSLSLLLLRQYIAQVILKTITIAKLLIE